MLLHILLLCLGMFFLYCGSEWLVKGAASLALGFAVRPVIIGLTVVAFATSAPELLVSLIAAVEGSSGVSLGNILGSNVANIGLVVGISALIRPLTINHRIIYSEIPFMIGFSGMFWILCLDSYLGRLDGVFLLLGLAIFLIYGMLNSIKKDIHGDESLLKKKSLLKNSLLIIIGMAGLLGGADILVKSSIFIARFLGFSDIFIGLSIVALGTSLPELATSIVAGVRGEHEISIGNVVGSNIFNLGLVMGMVALINPMSLDSKLLYFEFPAMFIVSLLLFVFCRTGYIINRIEGLAFITSYVLFIGISFISH